jgi:hypothetical protein
MGAMLSLFTVCVWDQATFWILYNNSGDPFYVHAMVSVEVKKEHCLIHIFGCHIFKLLPIKKSSF